MKPIQITKITDIRRLLLFPIVAGTILMLLGATVAWVTTVGDNKDNIKTLQTSKVDTQKFMEFVKIYGEFLVLTEERHKIINTRLDLLEARQREIELNKLKVIEQNIAILQEKMKVLLKEYGFYNRDGEEMKLSVYNILGEFPPET